MIGLKFAFTYRNGILTKKATERPTAILYRKGRAIGFVSRGFRAVIFVVN